MFVEFRQEMEYMLWKEEDQLPPLPYSKTSLLRKCPPALSTRDLGELPAGGMQHDVNATC